MYGWVSSAHQKPIGQPVCFEVDGLEATSAMRFGFSGLEMSTDALIVYSSVVGLQGISAMCEGSGSTVCEHLRVVCEQCALPPMIETHDRVVAAEDLISCNCW